MDVILKQDIKGLGYANEMVTVKDGYARNYLIPQGIASLATASMKKVIAENERQQAHKAEKLLSEAKEAAKALEGKVPQVKAKVGEQGRIFGSINTIMLAEALKEMGVEVDRKNISLKAEAIKETGTYEAEVEFHREVKQTLQFEVVAE